MHSARAHVKNCARRSDVREFLGLDKNVAASNDLTTTGNAAAVATSSGAALNKGEEPMDVSADADVRVRSVVG